MLPELLRFSSGSHVLSLIPEELQAHHRVQKPTAEPVQMPSRALGRAGRLLQSHEERKLVPVPKPPPKSLWDGWTTAPAVEADDVTGDIDLHGLGL
jgi:hypothetical protein